MRLLAALVCLYCVLMASQGKAQSAGNNFTSIDSQRLTAEFTPVPYGTRSNAGTVRKWKRQWIISAVALVAASMADAGSSWGKNEANPALQQAGNRFGGRSVAIKLGLAGIPLLMQRLAARNNEGFYKSFAIANYGGAAFFAGAAVRNYRVSSKLSH